MNKKSGSGTAMFIMEMIMVIFFFILCASTCILVFAKANSMSRLARDTNQSVIAAESVAEVWKAEGRAGVAERFAGSAGTSDGAKDVQDSLIIYWDEQWQMTGPESALYSGSIKWSTDDGLDEAEIGIVRLDDGTALYNLTAKKYRGSRESGRG